MQCETLSENAWCVFTMHVPRAFVEESEGVYEPQTYSALETVAILNPSAVSALVPMLSKSLRNTEQKRGMGKNTSLR